MAASWIMGTSCARLGRIAKIRRGVKGIMTSWLMLKNSAIQRRAGDCCISLKTHLRGGAYGNWHAYSQSKTMVR